MPEHELRCIVVGMGGISKTMLRELAHKPWYRTVAVVDVRDEALALAGTTLGLPATALFTDLDRALASVHADAVLINTPSELHYAQARAAIAAGRHVLVAKPVTNDYEQAVELVDLAVAHGVTHSVGQQMRYNRHYTAVRRFVAAGALGAVEAAYFLNSKPRPEPANLARMPQPSLYENACHHFDAFLGIFADQAPEWVSCDGFIPSWSPYVGPCMVNALIRFSGGLHLLYHGGFSARAPLYELRLEGAQGVLSCHGIHMSNDTMRYEFAPELGAFAPATIDEGIPARSPWQPFFDLWHDYVLGGPEPSFSGRNNLPVFALLSAAIASVEEGNPVEVAGNPRYERAFRQPAGAAHD
ncbi:MAG: Gfo/Idh/MocA family protein [Thermomicrobiales bacterium]